MIQINYKGKPTNYPLYDTIEQAKKAMLAEGLDEEEFEDTWTSPRGIENKITFKELENEDL